MNRVYLSDPVLYSGLVGVFDGQVDQLIWVNGLMDVVQFSGNWGCMCTHNANLTCLYLTFIWNRLCVFLYICW